MKHDRIRRAAIPAMLPAMIATIVPEPIWLVATFPVGLVSGISAVWVGSEAADVSVAEDKRPLEKGGAVVPPLIVVGTLRALVVLVVERVVEEEEVVEVDEVEVEVEVVEGEDEVVEVVEVVEVALTSADVDVVV